MTNAYPLVIDGQLVPGSATLNVTNPATEELVSQCGRADEAVEAAKRAQPAWNAMGVEGRRKCLLAILEDFTSQANEFAQLLTAEQGKPLQNSHEEMALASFVLRAFAEMKLETKVLHDDAARRVIEHHTPLGVVAAITPWNFPLFILLAKLGPALLAGNTVVAKPAPTTPLTTLKFGALCLHHLPAGVLNVIADDNDLGGILASHPSVAKVSFTGSTATGRKVMASAAATLKRITLELGGNDAAIILADADPKQIAPALFWSAFYNAGQTCVAVKRVYAHATIYDALCEEMAALAKACVVGNGAEPETTLGPIHNRAQFEKVSGMLKRACDAGKVIAGGGIPEGPGYFIEPTIIRDIGDDAEIVKMEQFAPILPIIPFDDVEDAICRANATEYGLGASVWSADENVALDIACQLDAGTVWINGHAEVVPDTPFRGAKQSGLGTEFSQEGIEEYTQPHVVSVKKAQAELAG